MNRYCNRIVFINEVIFTIHMVTKTWRIGGSILLETNSYFVN